MKRDFILFQREFKVWQERLGLTGYKVYFRYEHLDSCFASIKVGWDNMVAVVTFNSSISKEDKPDLAIKKVALHEALHLLLARVNQCAKRRYVTEDQIFEADEEAVNKLERLLHHARP